MKALDTNVLVRFLVDAEGDPLQHTQATDYMQQPLFEYIG